MAFQAQERLAHIAVIAQQSAHMAQAFRRWPVHYWQRPTFCPGWTAADAVAHLATGSEFYAQAIQAGQSGTPQLPWGVTTPAAFREARAAAQKALLDAGPSGVLAGFEQGAQRLQAVFEALQETDLGKTAWHPRGLIPLGGWIGMRINELAMHDWDIRQPHETAAHVSALLMPALSAILPEMQEQFLRQRLSGDSDGVYVLQAGQASWGFTIQGATVTSHAAAPASYDACIRAEAECMSLLSMGRADAAVCRQHGTLTLYGDEEKGLRLCAILFRAL